MLSENIYHRVYQLVKRNVDLRIIAATLNLPLRSVLNVIARIEKNGLGDEKKNSTPNDEKTLLQKPAFLDSYFVPRNRYAILQFVGFVVKEMKEKIEAEFLIVKLSTWKIVAIQLTEVTVIDETGVDLLLNFCAEIKSRDRFIALLDPSLELESTLAKYQVESKVPIFGTKWAFEENAFNSKNTPTAFHQKNRSPR